MEQLPKDRAIKKSIINEKYLIKTFGFFVLALYALIVITPFYYLLASSLKNMGQFYSTELREVWFPWPLHFSNYIKALTQVPLLKYMFNSLILAVSQTGISLLSSALVAYGFSRFDFRGKNVLFVIVLATMMLPAQVTNIPLFILYKQIKWLNTFLPLIVPMFFGGAYNIFLMRQFMLAIPKEMDEAAQIDGCNSLSIFFRIILPQSIPVMIVAGVFTFMWSWKDLWGPLIYISNSKYYTLPIGLLFFESPTDFQYTMQLAAVLTALVPTAVFFILGQKYLEKGINISELK
jgi:multiple sugar transport system permease protein